MAYDGDPATAERIKVFLSYSRNDSDFALDLVAGLQACGFEAFIDQEDIAPGEPWEARLGGMIESADTVVYIISPDSLSSSQCSWEVDETLRHNKRLLPVVWREVADGDVPKTLSKLNYTFFSGRNTFAQGLRDLSAALRVDHDWIRDHTRIGALARRWDARGRNDDLLLRGAELDAAAEWADRRPSGAPGFTDVQIDFLAVGKAARDRAERAARNRRRGLLAGVSAVALVTTGLAAFAGLQWYQSAIARQGLAEANAGLAAANLRLSSDIALRAPPTGTAPFEARGGWFPVAANYAGAVVRLQRRESQNRQIITGFLIDGALIHPALAGETMLLAPQFKSEQQVLAEDARLDEFLAATDESAAGALAFAGETFSRGAVVPAGLPDPAGGVGEPLVPPEPQPFGQPDLLEQRYIDPDLPPPGLGDTPGEVDDLSSSIGIPSANARSGRDMFEQTERLPASPGDGADGEVTVSFPTLISAGSFPLEGEPVWRTPAELGGAPQFAVHAIGFDLPLGARAIQRPDLDCVDFGRPLFSDGLDGATAARRYALFGIDGAASKLGDSEALTLLVTTGFDLPDSGLITYRHATLKGAFGAPVFDLDTGKVVGIHQGVNANASAPEGRVGIAEPLLPLLDQIRDRVSIDRRDTERTSPLCASD